MGGIVYGNNWRRMRGIPMQSHKRYPNERKDMPKKVRICFHAMIEAGCDWDLMRRVVLSAHKFDIGEKPKRIGKHRP